MLRAGRRCCGGRLSAYFVSEPPSCSRSCARRSSVGRGGLDSAGTDPPCRMDLVPTVLSVGHPRADDLDPRALGRNRDARAVVRDHLDDQVSADPLVAVVEQLFVAGIEAKIEMEVAVVGLGPDLPDRPDHDGAAALHVQALRVVDAGERVPAAAVRRGRGDLPLQAACGGAAGEEDRQNHRRPAHGSRVPVPARARKSLFGTRLESTQRGRSSVGRASASQAEGRGFDPRRPLRTGSGAQHRRPLTARTRAVPR